MPSLASASTLRLGWACQRAPATATLVVAVVCARLPLSERPVGGDKGAILAVGRGTTLVRHENTKWDNSCNISNSVTIVTGALN